MDHRLVFTHLKRGVLEPVKSRRVLIGDILKSGAVLPLLPLTLRLLESRGQGSTVGASLQSEAGKRPAGRFLHIFLRGGWDSHLATDPVVGARAVSDAFEPVYASLPGAGVPGKSNLRLGAGLIPASSAFANMPTTFVNGLFTEVTAHELATNYMFSGVLSLSRSREFPALAALLGQAAGSFPAHVVIGAPIPLGTTRESAPPLQAQSSGTLANMLQGPYTGDHNPTSIDVGHRLLAKLDERYLASLNAAGKADMASWINSGSQIDTLYKSNYGTAVQLTDAVKTRYNFTEDWSIEGTMAGGFLTLKSGISPFVTISIDGFDTHSNHLGPHRSLLERVASGLSTLVSDLRNTPDPETPGVALSETTTIFITSEFVRTPKFNAGNGTDHWPSASAIVMGRGVRDNQIIGATDHQAMPLGWSNSGTVPLSSSTRLLPENLVASVLRHLGYSATGDVISAGGIDEIFV
jgi:hypothetical protein